MKKLLLLASIFLILTTSVNAQITCGSIFTDSGTANGNYQNSENITYLICPSNSNEIVTINFTSFALESGYDNLKIYNGNTVNSPLLANLTGSTIPSSVSSTIAGGCLTAVFTSDSSITLSGWIANVTCSFAPTCIAPSNVSTSILSQNTMQLSWTENGTATQWGIKLNGNAYTTTSNNPYVFTNLNPGQSYNVQVYSICNANDVSSTTPNFTFTTPPCSVPNSLSVSNVTTNSAELSWQDVANSQWEVAVQLASINTEPTTGVLTNSSSNFLISNLQNGTQYKFYVRNNCGINSIGNWSVPFTFFTATLSPTCGGNFVDNGGISGNYFGSSNELYVICPDSPNESVTVTFTQFNTEANWDGLYVYDGNSVTSPQIASINGAGYGSLSSPGAFWGNVIPAPFTSSSSDGCLTFKFFSDASVNNSGWVANVTCNTQVTCPMPYNLTATQTSTNTTLLNWNTTNNATQWEVLVTSNSNTTGQSYIVNQNNFTASNLIQSEVYVFEVRAICSATEFSNWNTLTYQLLQCTTPQMVAVNTITPNSAFITWQNNTQNSNQFEILVLPSGSPTPTSQTSGVFTTSSNPFYVNGLIPATAYDVYVRTMCSFNGISVWSGAVSFTTLQYLPSVVASTSLTPDQIVTTLLANNPCIDITNITSSTGTNFGSTNGIGTFTNTNPNFPISSGIILSSGSALNVSGPNSTILSDGTNSWLGDTQLENIITTATGTQMLSHNATKLEFDFTTLNEFMSFNFLFASEEYGMYQCAYSDSFAFLLTDLITNTTTNIAVVPGTTTPISVVTIRDNQFNTTCSSENIDYFDVYNDAFSSATNFNGQTTLMTASSALIPNHPYHIKLVIADRGDTLFDSAVFIEAGAFTAGPPQCTDKINLISFVDSNNNGTKDSGEYEFAYGSFLVDQNNSGNSNSITSPIGIYTIYDDNTLNVYDFNYQINPEYAPYYSLGSVNYNDISIPLGSGTQTFYFPVTQIQGFNDVTVSLSSVSQPRPGFNYTNKVVYKNLGNSATSGTINFTKSNVVTVVSVSQNGTIANTDGFSYSFTNLQPYETRMFTVTMAVADAPIVNLNDVVTNNVTISAPSNDINVTNNSFSNSQIAVVSYDPNYINESHGGKIVYNQFTVNDYLYYTIHFQNIGTANAINVRIVNNLDAQLDENSIRMMSASHNYIMERVGNHVTWKFDYINLVGALQSQVLSQGFLTFKIKLKPGFSVGTIIPSVASIYFDNNAAVVTDNFNTEFVAFLGNTNFDTSILSIYPNPANNNITINLQNTPETINSISITDVLGKKVINTQSISDNINLVNLDISTLSKGVYMVKIITNNKLSIVKKLIKN